MVAANMSGELQLKIEADDVTATTFFRELQNHIFGGWFLSHRVGGSVHLDCMTLGTQHHSYIGSKLGTKANGVFVI